MAQGGLSQVIRNVRSPSPGGVTRLSKWGLSLSNWSMSSAGSSPDWIQDNPRRPAKWLRLAVSAWLCCSSAVSKGLSAFECFTYCLLEGLLVRRRDVQDRILTKYQRCEVWLPGYKVVQGFPYGVAGHPEMAPGWLS